MTRNKNQRLRFWGGRHGLDLAAGVRAISVGGRSGSSAPGSAPTASRIARLEGDDAVKRNGPTWAERGVGCGDASHHMHISYRKRADEIADAGSWIGATIARYPAAAPGRRSPSRPRLNSIHQGPGFAGSGARVESSVCALRASVIPVQRATVVSHQPNVTPWTEATCISSRSPVVSIAFRQHAAFVQEASPGRAGNPGHPGAEGNGIWQELLGMYVPQ
jgi:hypothetical protein